MEKGGTWNKSRDHCRSHIGLEKKAGNWTWVNGRQLNFQQWIKNLSNPDGEVASISWKSNDGFMQVKSGARDADSPYICEFHKGNSLKESN